MATAVVLVFAAILVVGLFLRMRTKRALEHPLAEPKDLESLADPSRWPAPPDEPAVDDAVPEDEPPDGASRA